MSLTEAIDQAVSLDPSEHARFVQQIVAQPEAYMDELSLILKQKQSPRWLLAVQLFEAIGYPQNAQAIPALVGLLTDPNNPTYYTAVDIVKNLPQEAVIPHLIALLWDRGDMMPSHYYNDIEKISGVIASYDRSCALACGPLVASLMSRYLHQLELEPMLRVIEAIGPEESLYALPIV